jgi:hypothetical protein
VSADFYFVVEVVLATAPAKGRYGEAVDEVAVQDDEVWLNIFSNAKG